LVYFTVCNGQYLQHFSSAMLSSGHITKLNSVIREIYTSSARFEALWHLKWIVMSYIMQEYVDIQTLYPIFKGNDPEISYETA
jgi:hypothetical protein